jgi:glycosyltransferase involved in cell wall biosynthesis
MKTLMVLVPDAFSAIIDKGEYQPNYYNPGDFFDEVVLVTTADDRVEPEALRSTVGSAKVSLYSFPEAPALIHGDWRADDHAALRAWAGPIVALAAQVRPRLIRCHGADWNTYAAARIRAELGIPYVVSLHINADVNAPRRHLRAELSPEQWRENEFFEHLERAGLAGADLVMPVYKSVLPYLERMGVTRHQVCYNVLSTLHLRRKDDYRLHDPARLLYVGRLFGEKDPGNILRAMSALPGTELTVVGDGPLRPGLELLAEELGLAGRVLFRPAVRNDELCALLPEFDLFTIHSEYWELNKSLLEALLTGLPCVVNQRRGLPVPELAGADIVRFVPNTPEGYGQALAALMQDDAAREALGRRAYAHAQAHWAPAKAEAAYLDIYKRCMLDG